MIIHRTCFRTSKQLVYTYNDGILQHICWYVNYEFKILVRRKLTNLTKVVLKVVKWSTSVCTMTAICFHKDGLRIFNLIHSKSFHIYLGNVYGSNQNRELINQIALCGDISECREDQGIRSTLYKIVLKTDISISDDRLYLRWLWYVLGIKHLI